MNRFELFTLIYFWLDAYYEDETDDRLITQISDMNPLIFASLLEIRRLQLIIVWRLQRNM